MLHSVTLRLSYRRSHEDFLNISEWLRSIKSCKYSNRTCVRKMTLTDHVLSAMESILIKILVNYSYQEKLTKILLPITGQFSWQHEDIFAPEPVRQLIRVTVNAKNAFFLNKSNECFSLSNVWTAEDYFKTEVFAKSKYTN